MIVRWYDTRDFAWVGETNAFNNNDDNNNNNNNDNIIIIIITSNKHCVQCVEEEEK